MRQRLHQLLGPVALGQVHLAQVAGPPVDQGGDRRAAHRPHDQVAFPVTKATALPRDRRPLFDPLVGQHVAAAPLRCRASALAQRPPGSQPPGELAVQPTAGPAVAGLVDRLVAELTVRPATVASQTWAGADRHRRIG